MRPRFVLTLLALAAPVLAGCLEPNAFEQNSLGPPLEVTIEPEDATLAPGESVTLTVKLLVRIETEITHRGCPPELVDAFVRWADQDQVRLYEYGDETRVGACAVRNVTLEKGVHEREVQWNGHTQAAAPDPHEGPRVGANTFTVVGRLAAQDRDVSGTGTITVTG